MELSGFGLYAKLQMPVNPMDTIEVGHKNLSKDYTLNVRISGLAIMAIAFLTQTMTSYLIIKCAILIAGAVADAYLVSTRVSSASNQSIFFLNSASSQARNHLV